MRMDLGEKIEEWAGREPTVSGLVLIGSRAREPEDRIWRADVNSDWDFQIITTRPEMFADGRWLINSGLNLRAYAVRRAAIGGVPKIAAVFKEGEADFVIAPYEFMNRMRHWILSGEHRTSPEVMRSMQDLAVVIRPGWRFLRGARDWEPFYLKAVEEVPDPRLEKAQILNLAEGFVCDWVWARRKLQRGELVAAQRMLHRSLAEANFQLLHEFRIRQGLRSFPEGRRAELVVASEALEEFKVEAALERQSLERSLDRCAATCRRLVAALVGEAWHWPQGVG